MRQGAHAQRDGLDLLRDNPYKQGLDARGRDVAAEWARGWLAAAQGDEPPDLDTEGDGGADGDF